MLYSEIIWIFFVLIDMCGVFYCWSLLDLEDVGEDSV